MDKAQLKLEKLVELINRFKDSLVKCNNTVIGIAEYDEDDECLKAVKERLEHMTTDRDLIQGEVQNFFNSLDEYTELRKSLECSLE